MLSFVKKPPKGVLVKHKPDASVDEARTHYSDD